MIGEVLSPEEAFLPNFKYVQVREANDICEAYNMKFETQIELWGLGTNFFDTMIATHGSEKDLEDRDGPEINHCESSFHSASC